MHFKKWDENIEFARELILSDWKPLRRYWAMESVATLLML